MAEHVLVIGATLQDIKGKPVAGLEPGTSNPSTIKTSRGGTARNVAENLGRLGADVILMSAVGNDHAGRRLLEQTAEAGVNLDLVQMLPNARTGTYIAILDEDGSLSVALDDVSVMEAVNGRYLYQNRRLFRDAAMVMVDGSLSPDAWATAARLTRRYSVPLCADPASARVAAKLRPYLEDLYLVAPNEVEAANMLAMEFLGSDPDLSGDLARELVRRGVQNAVVTLANFGLVYATSEETGYIPANYTRVVDTTGTGDAVTAAIMFGMLNDLPAIEAIRLGAAAASLTLQTSETVVPDLSLDMLYDHLIV